MLTLAWLVMCQLRSSNVTTGGVWCKQRNSEKEKRLNNEQWNRMEQVTLEYCVRVRPGHVLCENTEQHTRSHITVPPPPARKVEADGR